MSNNTLLCSPRGRLLNFYIFDKKTTDYLGKQQPDESKHSFEAWVAIPKNDPKWVEYWAQAQNAAMQDFAQNQEYNWPNFSWKLADGDGVNSKNKPYPEHCKGCWLLSYTSNYDVEIYNDQNQPLTKLHNAVKAGDYVEIYGSFKGNGNTDKPGIFLNLNKLRVVGIGDAIISGPSAEQAFGAAAPGGGNNMPNTGGNNMPPQGNNMPNTGGNNMPPQGNNMPNTGGNNMPNTGGNNMPPQGNNMPNTGGNNMPPQGNNMPNTGGNNMPPQGNNMPNTGGASYSGYTEQNNPQNNQGGNMLPGDHIPH